MVVLKNRMWDARLESSAAKPERTRRAEQRIPEQRDWFVDAVRPVTRSLAQNDEIGPNGQGKADGDGRW